jgi:hypothetical protein
MNSQNESQLRNVFNSNWARAKKLYNTIRFVRHSTRKKTLLAGDKTKCLKLFLTKFCFLVECSVCPARQIGRDCRSARLSSIVLWRSVCVQHTHTHTHETYVSERRRRRRRAEWRQDLVKRRVYEEKEEEAGPSSSRHHSWKHMASSLFNNNQSSSKLL